MGGEREALARIDAAVLRLEAGGDDHLASDLDRLVVDCDGQGHARMALRARRFAMHARTVAAGIEAAAMDAWDLVGRLDAMGPTAPDALTSMSEAVSLLAPGVTDVACTGLMRDLDAVLDAWSAAAPLTVSLAIGRTTLLTRLGRHDEAEESARRTATALVAVGWLRGLDFALAHLAGPIARQGRLTDAAEVLGASAGVAPTGVEWAGLPEVRAARDLLDIDGDLLLRSHFDLGRRDPWGVLGGLGVS